MATTDQRSRYPDDATVWRPQYRNLSVRELARIFASDYSGLSADLRGRGWIRTRGQGSKLTHAPCRECRVPTPVEALTAERECPECVAPAQEASANVLLFRAVLAERRERLESPDVRGRLKRVGGPMADTLRRRRAA